MKFGPSVSKSFHRAQAFSLVELLTVMALMTMLAAASVPAFKGVMDGANITGATGAATSELTLARQTAMTRNVPVEIRIYKTRVFVNQSEEKFCLISAVIPAGVNGSVADEWLMAPQLLPGNVILDEAENYSTIVSKAENDQSTGIAPWTGREGENAPSIVKEKDYVAFQFRPDGSTNLPSDQPWCLTLRNFHAQPGDNRPADNFVSLVVDSHTGRTIVFQP